MSFSFNKKCSNTTLGLLEALIEKESSYMECLTQDCDEIYNFSEECIKHRTITLLKCFRCGAKISVKEFLKFNNENIVDMIKKSGINKNNITGYVEYKKRSQY